MGSIPSSIYLCILHKYEKNFQVNLRAYIIGFEYLKELNEADKYFY